PRPPPPGLPPPAAPPPPDPPPPPDVPRRLVVHVRRHSEHQFRASPQVPLGRPVDHPPVGRSHHRIHHAAEHGARRHGPQPLDQRVQRRWRATLHHRKGGAEPPPVKQAGDGRKVRTNGAGETPTPQCAECLEQTNDLGPPSHFDQRL